MNKLERQAILFFLVPLAAFILVALPYLFSGLLQQAVLHGPTRTDWAVWVALAVSMLFPPVWGYRLTVRIARSLAETTQVVRRMAEGDFSRTLAAWAADSSEFFHLEQGINATAAQLKLRLVELGQEKTRLESILKNMADGILLIDDHKRIILMNPAAEAMFGTSWAEAMGRDHLEVTHHFDLDELLQQVLNTGKPEVLEIKRAQPEEQILEARLAPSGAGVLLVLRDVTRSRRLEQMRTEFVSNVTHELRTPLTSVQGFAETLLEGALDDPGTARHFVTIIQKESGHLSRLIEDLLDLSRIESGRWRMRKEPIQLGQLAEDTVGRLTPRAIELGVKLIIAIPPDLPEVPGDTVRLAQVLLNLVDNALKYTPAGGSVTVSARDTGPTISISVADTGTGIPKADLPRIFERFYRVDKARSRSTGGTGLGLSIVKHIVDAHGGTISVASDTGQGATFTFTLPK
ncbi:MAG TPA: phosphate regulon sensor histidine kinase PhoR [Symbiobacteriaceae bacterium]|jgi:two-component system phosphate regulon sensor histidine kinase PhoR